MKRYKINYESVPHGVISWRHEGADAVYCEAGEEVRITWQPSAGWGLSEAHYTDAQGNEVAIDTKEMAFTMPESDITIGGTFKRFVVQDWTTDDPEQSGKFLGIDENGNLVPKNVDDFPPVVTELWLSDNIDLEIPMCTEELSNTRIPKVVYSISGTTADTYRIAGLITCELHDAAVGGNRINCWPVCQFTGNNQTELSVRFMCAGTSRKTAKRIGARVLLERR